MTAEVLVVSAAFSEAAAARRPPGRHGQLLPARLATTSHGAGPVRPAAGREKGIQSPSPGADAAALLTVGRAGGEVPAAGRGIDFEVTESKQRHSLARHGRGPAGPGV